MPSGRRTFLASIGAAAIGLSGCLGGDSSAAPTRTSTATPTGTPAGDAATLGDAVALDGTTVTVSDLVAAHSVRYLSAPDAMDVLSTSDDQFVFVAVSADGSGTPPAPRQFGLVAADARYGSGIEYLGPARVAAPVTGRQYGESNPEGFLGFRVPAPLDAESVAVVLGGDGSERTDTRSDGVAARWSIPSAAADPLRSPPPAFSATAEVPDSVPADEPIPVALDVTNEGDGPGVFRAAINQQGPLYGAEGIDRSLAAGESITHEATVDYYLDDDAAPGRVQFAVVAPGLSEFFEVTLDGGGTPGGPGTTTGTSR